MAFADPTRPAPLAAEMNITPLVDVMLVLLIIFMVAAPLLSRALPLDLPQAVPEPPPSPPVADLAIEADGRLRWNGRPMSLRAVEALMRVEASRETMPLLQLDVAPEAPYAHVALLLGKARAAGLTRIAVPEG